MTEPPNRPDPDVLLQRVKEEEAKASRGKLKIFFGFAPGVGKTYRMLQVAQDLKSERVDVVVGIVEAHRRFETENLLLGLERLPRRAVEYRGHTLDEFDLDAALKRRPRLLLLDELAHTNVPGSRHAKRWQDAMELLDAGIDVHTTLNVQHVESLNDVVAQITHVQVRETVPDTVLDRADEIELVDIAPEELLIRLKEGKVYLTEQAHRATEHFFRRGNLLALRELALRRTAQHVDADVLEYRAEHGVEATWPAGERILVCVGPAPSSDRLIRSACRVAAGLRAPWVAAYVDVESSKLGALSHDDRERLEAHLRLAEALGATVTRLSGARVSTALLAYARKHNVTRLVIGKPTHSRLWDRLTGSLLDEVVRGSGDVDVQVISGGDDAARTPERGAPKAEPLSPRPYVMAAVLVAVMTGIGLVARAIYPVPDLEVLYLLAVMITAVRFGRGPSILAAGLGVAAYDFFFVPPYFTFAVADARYFLTFAMMFGVGLLLSELTARIKRQEQDALTREERTAALYRLTRELGAAEGPDAATALVAQQAASFFAARAWVLRASDETLTVAASEPPGVPLDPKELGVAKWAMEHAQMAGLGTDTLRGSSTLCAPLGVGGSVVGVLALEPRSHEPLHVEQREFLEALCRQAAFAFERNRLADEARAAALKAKTEELRSSLLSTVSHDLRTPLAAITGAASSLRDDPGLGDETRRELLESICEEADRLEHLVANLLDMTRLQSGAVALKREWVPLEELVVSAVSRLESRLGSRKLSVTVAPDVPLVSVDPVLLEQLFVNLLENASKYTPAGSPIDVTGALHEGAVVVEVSDRGPGLPAGSEEKIFEKFVRGAHVGVGGVGLGLPICRGIAEAHGGSIRAANRAGGGAVFSVTLPLVGIAPTLPPEDE